MRLSAPRIPPLESAQWNDTAREAMQPFVKAGSDFNIFKTLTNHPDLMKRWMVFANHVLFKQSLAPRERELLILRIGYLCKAGYEWGQHVQVARRYGMSDDEIRSAKPGPSTTGLAELDRLLLQATDELHADAFVTDTTWQALARHLNTEQLMDLVFTVGQYNLVSMALNSFGVQPDEGLPGWDI